MGGGTQVWNGVGVVSYPSPGGILGNKVLRFNSLHWAEVCKCIKNDRLATKMLVNNSLAFGAIPIESNLAWLLSSHCLSVADGVEIKYQVHRLLFVGLR
jgi:hypothetical protein